MKIYYCDDYIVNTSKKETVNKAKWIAKRLKSEGYGHCLDTPRPIEKEELYHTHDQGYVNRLFDLSFSGESAMGSPWNESILKSIRYSNGGIRDAVLHAHQEQIAGSLSSGLHHAGHNYGKGFCQINGLAMGALKAKEMGYVVGILDVDAHCGGGTSDILRHTDIAIYDLSTSSFDKWTYPHPRQQLKISFVADHYLEEVKTALAFLKHAGCNFILHNAGMDPSLQGISFDTLNKREELIAHFCAENNMKVVWVLAGGYLSKPYQIDKKRLIDLHLLTFYHFYSRFK